MGKYNVKESMKCKSSNVFGLFRQVYRIFMTKEFRSLTSERKMKMKTTVSFLVYFITFLISGVLVFLFVLLKNCVSEEWIPDVLLGIGTGGVTSAIVALITDMANTSMQQREEKKLFERLTSDFDMACEELLIDFVVGAQEAYGIDDEKRTYIEWATMLLGDDSADERILYEADYALQQIKVIERQARRLLNDSRIHINNCNFDEELIKKIKRIQNYCQRIDHEHKRGKYKNCLRIIDEELVNLLIEYKPSMTLVFKEPFNWDEEYY